MKWESALKMVATYPGILRLNKALSARISDGVLVVVYQSGATVSGDKGPTSFRFCIAGRASWCSPSPYIANYRDLQISNFIYAFWRICAKWVGGCCSKRLKYSYRNYNLLYYISRFLYSYITNSETGTKILKYWEILLIVAFTDAFAAFI